MSLRAWIRAARPLAHGNIAPPILLGQAFAAAQTGRFSVSLAALAFGFGVLDHLFIVFANDYADRDADAKNEAPTFLSGGSRVLVDGELSPAALARAALVSAALLLGLCGAGGWWLARPWMLAFGAAALLLLFAYSFAPLRLSYRGFGEVAQGVGVGLVLPLMGYYAQAGELERAPYGAFAPLIVLAFVSNILTALPDTAGDRAAGKLSWPVRRSEPRARRDALILLGVGLMFVTQVGPPLDSMLDAVVVGPPALCALMALRYLKRGDFETNREDAMRFVIFALGAITLVQLTWSVVLLVAG